MKKFLKNAVYVLPHPFKAFQRYFQIEEEISQLKAYFKPYRFSLLIFFSLLSYPWLRPPLETYCESAKKRVFSAFSAINSREIEHSSKQIIQSVLQSAEIKHQGALYVETLAKEPIVKDSIVKLLENSVKDPIFVRASKDLAKELGDELLREKQIEENAGNLVRKLLQSPEIKQETSEVVKWVFLQEIVKEKLVDLLKSGFEEERLKNSLREALSSSFYEILNQQETIEKLKMFSYFLMENDPEESENVRNFIDSIVEKVVNKKREDSRKSELDKILNEEAEIKGDKEKTHRKDRVL